MSNELINNDNEINNIFNNIKDLVINSRSKVFRTVNTEMLSLYWNIGKAIMEIQQGDERASYGDAVLEKLSEKLTNEFGKGFSSRNLRTMRKFYLIYPIWKTVSADKNKILELSEKGQVLKTSKDLVKDPLVLEFLDIKENTDYLESDLEKNIIEHLKEFLLELRKRFSYVGNQVRLTLEEDHFYPDLVFYNRLLRCFVIIDLKMGKVSHQDIGQMQMYVNYYDREIKQEDENKTVGILLSTNKNETVVKYTLPEDNKTIFSSEYKLHMPTEHELISAVEEEKKNFELNDEI